MMIPGIHPARNILPTDTFATKAKRMSPMPGGMIGVIIDEAAVTAALKSLS